MELVSKLQAKQTGSKRFFTGVPCVHGHLAQRYVSNGGCCVCVDTANNVSYKNGYQAEWKRKLRLRALDSLGGRCVKCGFSDWRALQIDHVKGKGKQDRAKFCSSDAFYNHVIKTRSKDYQILCANCNWIKKYVNGEAG